MADDIYDKISGLTDPAVAAVAVTPSDSADLTQTTRSLYIGVAGDVAVYMTGATTSVTFVGVPIGVLPIRVDRILATGTTANSIVALW